jgi:TPR repeat protein
MSVISAENEEDPLESLWSKAYEASARGDYPGVLFVWKALAEKGVWQIEARIGELYERGAIGVEKDTQQALHWYRKAVFDGDDAVAHVGLGRAYYTGTGVERDFIAALEHFRKAFASNLPEAAIYLGLMYYRGTGVQRNVQRAEEYFFVAAKANYPAAYSYLARIALDRGRLFKAVKLFVKGAILGVRVARKDTDDPRLLGIDVTK